MDQESFVRLAAFFSVLLVVGVFESLFPRRRLTASKPRRWFANLGIVILNSLLVRLLIPLGAVGSSLIAARHGWGLLNLFELPPWFAIPVAALLLDLAIYLQHRVFHAVPVLWRLHMVHHADVDIDVSTGLRFHPIEILLSMLIKMVVVVLTGAPVAAVIIFEIVLNATAMFNHGNFRLPVRLDRWLRLLVVTPDMHRVHHSVLPDETNSNYGFNLPWWDRGFGTYRAQPRAGHAAMTIGLSQFREARGFGWMLLLPFVGETGDYPSRSGVRG